MGIDEAGISCLSMLEYESFIPSYLPIAVPQTTVKSVFPYNIPIIFSQIHQTLPTTFLPSLISPKYPLSLFINYFAC